jgi:hypothetical protein
MPKKLSRLLTKAENNAKARDKNNVVDIRKVAEEARKAESMGYGLYKIRETSTVPFTQKINENIVILNNISYLSNAEMTLLWQIEPFCEFHTNAIINPKTKEFMSISEMARLLSREVSGVSRVINDLLEKGILYEFVNAQEIRKHGRPVSKRPLFFNPEFIYSGDKNRIDAVLCRLCMESDIMEKKGILLEWKLWLHSGDQYGRLYKRKTHLKYKKAKETLV